MWTNLIFHKLGREGVIDAPSSAPSPIPAAMKSVPYLDLRSLISESRYIQPIALSF